MNISATKAAAARVWFDDANLWLELTDGRRLAVPLAYFPRLQRATTRQRAKFEMSGGGTGLHWDALDEDISVAGLLAGRGDQTRTSGNGRRGVSPTPMARGSRPSRRNRRRSGVGRGVSTR